MINKEKLKRFLLESNKSGYASGNSSTWTKESDRSTTITYEKGNWKSHDNYFGGEPYGGRVIVFYKEKPVWIMVYYGWIEKGFGNKPIYAVLQNALKRMPENMPLRGPKEYKEESYIYENQWEGNIGRYSGQEEILQEGKRVYEAIYLGGLINQ